MKKQVQAEGSTEGSAVGDGIEEGILTRRSIEGTRAVWETDGELKRVSYQRRKRLHKVKCIQLGKNGKPSLRSRSRSLVILVRNSPSGGNRSHISVDQSSDGKEGPGSNDYTKNF